MGARRRGVLAGEEASLREIPAYTCPDAAGEAEPRQIELIDENSDNADRVILDNIASI
jgi:hypothetical protein